MKLTWKLSQWAFAIFLTVGIMAFFISASVMKARMDHLDNPTNKYRNLTPSVHTLVIESGWNNLKVFLGNESYRRNVSPNSDPFRPKDFLKGITNCSVEIFSGTGVVEGLLKQAVEQRGDTLFVREPDQRFPGLLRLNLPALASLNIISQEDIRLFVLPDSQATALDHLQFAVSNNAEVQVNGPSVETLSVVATDEASLFYSVNDDRPKTSQVMIDAQDHSFIKINGFRLPSEEMSITLKDQAVFINEPIRTYTAWGSLANEQ